MSEKLTIEDFDEWIEEQNENYSTYAVQYPWRGDFKVRVMLERNGRGVIQVFESKTKRYKGMDRDKALEIYNSLV